MRNHLRIYSFVFVLLYTLICTSSIMKFSTTGNSCNLEVANGKRFRRRSTSSLVIFDEGINGMKWNKKNITYRISAYSDQLTKIFVDAEIAKAFRLWSAHADLEFFENNNSTEDVDIDIKFCQGNHGDSTPFRTFDIAHAFAPEEELGGDIHFNENFTFWHDGTTFLHTATHEIGHALGLHHIPLNYAVMSPYQSHAGFPVHLSLEDIKNVQALYGKKTSQYPPPPPPPPVFQTFTTRTTQKGNRRTTFKTTTRAPSVPPKFHNFKDVFEPPETGPGTGTAGGDDSLERFTKVSTTGTTVATSTTASPTTTTTKLPLTTFPTELLTTTVATVTNDQDIDNALEGSGTNEISDTESDEDISVYMESVTDKLSEPPGDWATSSVDTDITLEEKNEDGVMQGNSNGQNGISSTHKTQLLITIPICLYFARVLIRI